MRYVIVFAAIAFFLAWDMVYNQGQYIDLTFLFLSRLLRPITG
jgi:hypothetical protein